MNDETKGYPKYQYSVFLKNGKDAQLVIRADDWEEFLEAKKNINTIIDKVESPLNGTAGSQQVMATATNGMNCMTCGQPAEQKMGVSKAGKPYNGIFCSTNNKSHTKWL